MNDFKVGCVVLCVESIGSKVLEGSIHIVISVDNNSIGFVHKNLSEYYYTEGVKRGTNPNWGMKAFKVITPPTMAAKVLFGESNE